jgi:hypothetical protein
VWSLKDPLRKKALKLTSELLEKEDIINEPEIEICKCNNEIVWIGIELLFFYIAIYTHLYIKIYS